MKISINDIMKEAISIMEGVIGLDMSENLVRETEEKINASIKEKFGIICKTSLGMDELEESVIFEDLVIEDIEQHAKCFDVKGFELSVHSSIIYTDNDGHKREGIVSKLLPDNQIEFMEAKNNAFHTIDAGKTLILPFK